MTDHGAKDRPIPGLAPGVIDPLYVLLAGFRGLSLEDARAFRDEIAETGVVRVLGFGSLMWKPHHETDCLRRGVVHGYRRDFAVMEFKSRGALDRPGLTLSIEPDPEAATTGAVLETSADAAYDSLLAFIRREDPEGMPLYRFAVVPVALRDGSTVNALACIANEDGPLYVGRSLDMDAKAKLIARAKGPNGTSFSYLVNTVRALHEQGDRDFAMERLLVAAKRARAALPEAERLDLEAFEASLYPKTIRFPVLQSLDTQRQTHRPQHRRPQHRRPAVSGP